MTSLKERIKRLRRFRGSYPFVIYERDVLEAIDEVAKETKMHIEGIEFERTPENYQRVQGFIDAYNHVLRLLVGAEGGSGNGEAITRSLVKEIGRPPTRKSRRRRRRNHDSTNREAD